ncbi:MAG TPA: alpha/beta fold hydrolase [Marmoricola sp.]|nr:alpha/beta fold hydrolase [Marmoricola sp.]
MTLTPSVGVSGHHGRTRSRSLATRRPIRAVAAAAAYLAALVILSTGVGLALPRLSKDDGGPALWIGLSALVTGVAAVTWTGWRLLRRTRRRWWLLSLPALLVAAYLALWTVGQGVAASIPARPSLGSRTPADLGLGYETATVRTADGVDLAAWWVPSRNGAAVLLLHGAGSTRTSVLDQAAVLGRHGYGVLLIDARGHGESGGRGMDFGWYGESDATAALDFLTTRAGVDAGRIGIVGLSMGGESAIGAAGVDPRVRAVVAEGATTRVAADKAFLSAAYGVRGDLQRGIDRATYAVAGLLTAAPQPASLRDSVVAAQADGSPTPMLLITAGTVDTERLAAEYLDRAAPDAVERWTVPHAGHTGGLRTAPTEWKRRVLGFLDTALAPVAVR